MDEPERNPMNHPDEQPAGAEGAPRFGRLLLVLLAAVLLIVLLTYLTELYYS